MGNRQEIEKILLQITKSQRDYVLRASLAKQGFALSLKEANNFHPVPDATAQKLTAKLMSYGDGWWAENARTMVISLWTKENVVSHMKSWQKFYNL